MKKFYTIIGQQHIGKVNYGHKNLTLKCMFPITAHISTVIKEGEKFEVVAVDSFDTMDSHKNVELLKEELKKSFNNDFEFHYVNAHFDMNKNHRFKRLCVCMKHLKKMIKCILILRLDLNQHR